VKPLQAIWNKFPQFNKTNTILCDDKKEAFHLNPENGILITRFLHKKYGQDDELLKLAAYLKSIAQYDDLSAIDHRVWRLEI
ncbi:hypothetical protein ILUMI_23105, partial [Ignelater luminosus]